MGFLVDQETTVQVFPTPFSGRGYAPDVEQRKIAVPFTPGNNRMDRLIHSIHARTKWNFAVHERYDLALTVGWGKVSVEYKNHPSTVYNRYSARCILDHVHRALIRESLRVTQTEDSDSDASEYDEEAEMLARYSEYKDYADRHFPKWRGCVVEQFLKVQKSLKFEKQERKLERLKLRRIARREKERQDEEAIQVAIQSGGRANVSTPKEDTETVWHVKSRERREAIQREKAAAAIKAELRSEYCKQKSKTIDKRRKRERQEKQAKVELQGGVMDYVTFPIRMTKAIMSVPSTVANAAELANDAVNCLKSSDSDVQHLFSSATAAIINMNMAAERASDHIEQLAARSHATLSNFDTAIASMEYAAATIPEASQAAKSTFDTITDIMQSLKESLLKRIPAYLVNCLMAGFLYYVMTQVESPLLRTMIAGMTGMLFLPQIKQLLDEVFKGVLELYAKATKPGETRVEQQSGGNMLPLLGQIVGTVVIGSFFNTKLSEYNVKKTGLTAHMMDTLGKAPRTFKGVESVMETVCDLAEAGVNMVRKFVDLPPIKFSMKLGKELADLTKEVYEFEYLMDTKKTNMKPVVQHTTIMGLMERVKTQMFIHTGNLEVKRSLESLKTILNRLAIPVRHTAGKDIGYRVQPASVIIAGRPGIGKTLMTQTIALAIMKLCGAIADGASAEEASQAVFVKPYNSAYMDGYHGQFAYLIDDLFAIKPNPNSEANSYADVMTYYGSYTAMLNMADCAAKGMYPFTSRLLLMTTNCRDLTAAHASQILLDEEAFTRRIDFHIELFVKPEYRLPNSHMLDPAKFAQEQAKCGNLNTLDVFPWHIWEYHDTKFGQSAFDDGVSGKPLKGLLVQVAQRIQLNERNHEGSMEMLNKMIKAEVDDSWRIQQQSGETPVIVTSTSTETIVVPKVSYWPATPSLVDALIESIDHSSDDEEKFPPYATQRAFPMSLTEEEFDQEASEWLLSVILEDPDRAKSAADYIKETKAFRAEWKERAIEKAPPMLAQKIVLKCGQLYEYVTYVYELLPSSLKWFAMATATGAISIMLLSWLRKVISDTYHWLKSLIWGNVPVVEVQSNGPKVKARSVKFVTQQSGGDVVGAWYNVYKNTYKAAISLPDGNFFVLGQILFLEQSLAVMPYHFIVDIKDKLSAGTITEDSIIHLRSCAMKALYTVSISVKVMLAQDRLDKPERDLCFMNFNRSLRPHKDIKHFFLKSKEIDDIGGYPVRLDTARMDNAGVLLEFNERVSYMCPVVQVGKGEQTIGQTCHKRWLKYEATTTFGDCGAVLSLTDSTSFDCRFIAGLHVGYDKKFNRAYSTPIDVEIVMDAHKHFGIKKYVEGVETQSGWAALGIATEAIEEFPFADAETLGFGSFEPLLKVSPGAPLPMASALRPTPFKETEFFKDEIASFYGGKQPEPLAVMKLGSYQNAEGEIVFPMLEAMRPFSSDIRIIDQKSFKRSVNIFMGPFSEASVHYNGRRLTFEEAVLGCPAFGLRAIERKSSVGYPCSVQTKNKDKSYYFGNGEVYDITTEEALGLKEDVECLEAMLHDGVRPFFVCRDFLKDEVRKKGKNARLIAGTELRYYLLCRMYFGAFVAALTKLHQKSGICNGMNHFSEWEWLKQHVTRPGDKVWDGDFAGFDESQQSSMLWPILDYINDWYALRGSAEDNAVRELLFYDFAHSRHLMAASGTANIVGQWNKSVPSGHLLTSSVNGVQSGSQLVDSYIATTGNLDFWENASVATQGDDNLCCASDKCIDKFNQITVAEHLKKTFGSVYTAGRKGEALRKYMSIEEVIFLQRRFARKGGHVVCPIRPESFLNCLYYTKKGDRKYKRKVLIDGLENALEELSMHTEEQWRIVAPRVVEAMVMLDHAPRHNVEHSGEYLEIVRSRVPDYL